MSRPRPGIVANAQVRARPSKLKDSRRAVFFYALRSSDQEEQARRPNKELIANVTEIKGSLRAAFSLG